MKTSVLTVIFILDQLGPLCHCPRENLIQNIIFFNIIFHSRLLDKKWLATIYSMTFHFFSNPLDNFNQKKKLYFCDYWIKMLKEMYRKTFNVPSVRIYNLI